MQHTQYFMFGIQRSGTNYLQQLLHENFQSVKLMNRQGTCWKHSLEVPKGWDYGRFTFVIYKNPYTWVESMTLRNRVDWLKTQNRYPADDLHKIDVLNVEGMNIVNLAYTWRDFHTTWLRSDVLNPRTHLVIQYENLLDDQKRAKTLNTIRHLTKWDMKHPNAWVDVPIGKVSQSFNFNKKSKEYYQKQMPQTLTKIQTGAITHAIGPNLIREMGYEIL